MSLKYQIILSVLMLSHPLVADFPVVKDPRGQDLRHFLSRDYTIVLVVNKDTQDEVTARLAGLKEKFGKKLEELSQKDGGRLPLDDLQVLILLDGRKHLHHGLRGKVSKLDAPPRRRDLRPHQKTGPLRRLGKAVGRGVARKKAPKELAQGVAEGNGLLEETLREQTQGYLSSDRYRAGVLYLGANERFISKDRKKVRLKIKENGASANALFRFFGNNSQFLQAAIFSPQGERLEYYSGADLDPLQIATDYFEAKGIHTAEPDATVQFEARPNRQHDFSVFDRLQKLAKENEVEDMVETLEVLKRYLKDVSVCTGPGGPESAAPLADFLFDVFANVEISIEKLMNGNLITWFQSKQKIMDYIHTATVLTRKYLKIQKNRFPEYTKTKPSAFYKASYDIYAQVGGIVRVTPQPKSSIQNEWEGKDLDDYRDNPKWEKAVKAIELLQNEDNLHCQEYLDLNNNTPSLPRTSTLRRTESRQNH